MILDLLLYLFFMKATNITRKFSWKNVCINQLKNIENIIFDILIILRFYEIKVAKEELYSGNKPMKIWDVNVHNIVILKLIATKNISK